jgi:hypothetical protein
LICLIQLQSLHIFFDHPNGIFWIKEHVLFLTIVKRKYKPNIFTYTEIPIGYV